MAAYASSVTIYTPKAERVSRSMGMILGQIDITNYNSTTTEETSITKYFVNSAVTGLAKGIVGFTVSATENGYIFTFDKNTGKFKVYTTAATAVTNVSIADTAVTVASATAIAPNIASAAAIDVSTVASVNAAHSAYAVLYDSAAEAAVISAHAVWASANRVNVKAGIDAAVSATIVKIESAVNALTGTATALTEVANDVDVGTADFMAVGFIR
jgi:hypothetical protein